LQLFLDDGHEHIDRHGDPDLRLDRILRRPEKSFDPQMLLDPLEEQFDLPAILVKRADRHGRQGHLVGEKDERLAGFGVVETHPAQLGGVILPCVEAVQRNALIANDAGGSVRRHRIDAMPLHVGFGTRDEESPGQMQRMQAGKIDVAAIHHVDGPGLQFQQIERMHVVQLAIGDMDKAGNAALQVEQRMHLHRRLSGAKVRPRKHRKAQVDGGRVECIDCVGQIEPQVLAEIQLAGLNDQASGKCLPDTPVARFVGVRQRRSGHRFAKSHVVQLCRLGQQAGFDIPQALSVGQLREGHGSELLGAGQRPHPLVATVARHDPMKGLPRQKVHDLGEQRLAGVHGSIRGKARNSAGTAISNSNRRHPSSLGIPCHTWLSAIYPSI